MDRTIPEYIHITTCALKYTHACSGKMDRLQAGLQREDALLSRSERRLYARIFFSTFPATSVSRYRLPLCM